MIEKKLIYCNNCGLPSHLAKKCNQPILSYGLIILRIKNMWLNKFNNELIKYFFINKYTNNNNNNYKHIKIDEYLDKNYIVNKKKDDIKMYYDEVIKNLDFCMIRRKYTVNYIQLLRGQYDELAIDKLVLLLSRLTDEELYKIKTKEFSELWNDLWMSSIKSNKIQNEFNMAKYKFDFIKKYLNNILDKIKTHYNNPEWEFPKGRRNDNENNIDCALREFEEETGIKKNDITILDKINPIIENINGLNDKKYKITYYIGVLNNENIDIKLDENNIYHKIEISDIKFFNYYETNKNIRKFHEDKIFIVNSINNFIMYNLRYYDKYYKKDTIENDDNNHNHNNINRINNKYKNGKNKNNYDYNDMYKCNNMHNNLCNNNYL